MIDALDEALRQLLIREIPIRNGEVDVVFDQPSREWAARLSRPTLNVFMHDIRENQSMRQSEPMFDRQRNADGTVTQRRRAVRTDLHYLITAWANDPGDEHRLLAYTLMALYRTPQVPDDLLPQSLRNHPIATPIRAAQYDEMRNAVEVWQVLDNEMRPGIACVITVAMDPWTSTTVPMVRTREIRTQRPGRSWLGKLIRGSDASTRWSFGGTVHSEAPPDSLNMVLLERGLVVPIQADGRFSIGNLAAGEYNLAVGIEGQEPRRFRIKVPAADYTIEYDAPSGQAGAARGPDRHS